MSLVTKHAPDFEVPAVMGNGEIKKYHFSMETKGKYVLVFFYPLDFTFVCPSEIIAFDHRLKEFKDRGAEVIGVSVDSHFSHIAWKNTAIDKGGIGQVQYPLVADLTKNISRDYDVLINDAVALRGTFLIDQEGVVRHQVVNDLPLGRNIDEAIRMVDALKFFQAHGEVCPAGWSKGKKGMKADANGVAEYLAQNSKDL